MDRIFGYARCSTNETKQDVMRQVRELKAKGASDATIYKEYQSGAKVDRAELMKLLEIVEEGDTIVATEVSRLTRSMKQLVEILEFAKEKKIKLEFGATVVDCRTGRLDAMTQGMLLMMGVFAELEREMTKERIYSGLENAKAKGVKLGRHKTTLNDVPASFRRAYGRFLVGELNFSDCCRIAGVSRTAGYKYRDILKDA